ncbi:MAG: hypothetical protein KF768_08960 [Phycisphaeraceae bacterium]|nr:hypothetical protein [Phycisphaeraceae bacterium]
MSQTKRLVLLTGAALGVCAAGAAQAATSTDEVRAIVAEMMADAETRSSLLAGGDAGHDGKFFIAGDGFRLNVGGQIQFRYIMNFRDDENPGDDFSNGFQTRRTKLDFNGAINRNWDFRVLAGFDRGDDGGSGGGFNLEQAWVRYNFDGGMKLRWGQFKLPMLREELVESSRQLAVERSIMNEAFTQDRSQGIELAAQYDAWRWAVAFSDGLDSENTDFNGPGGSGIPFVVAGEAEYALTGRVEFLFDGQWKDFEDFTAQKGQDFGFMLGAAIHWQQSTQTPTPTDVDVDTLQFTVDASLEGDGWNLFGAFVYRWQEQSALGMSDTDLSDFGAVIQGGWRFAENTEVFVRWDAIFADEDRFGGGEDNFNFLTVGLNHYYAGHAAKASVDLVWSFQDTSNLVSSGFLPNTGVGLLGDSEENEVAIRLQFQLLF